jgi:GNAT superfamily N-acetyltransferase
VTDALRIEKLRREHNVDRFDCGQEPLNRFLVRYALQNQQAEASQTYVGLTDDEVVGFYTLVVAQIEYDDAPRRLGKGLAKHPIPLMLLARLAVATNWQGKGLGAGLLKDAMLHASSGRHRRHPRNGSPCKGRRRQGILRTLRLCPFAERSLPPVSSAEGRSLVDGGRPIGNL